MPGLNAFQPDCIFVSAGFDGHFDDALSQLQYREADFLWLGQVLKEAANKHAQGRLISVLEGGYALEPLALSVEHYLRGIMDFPPDVDEIVE